MKLVPRRSLVAFALLSLRVMSVVPSLAAPPPDAPSAKDVGFQNFPLRRGEVSVAYKVIVESEGRCMLGDIDTMKQDMLLSTHENHRLILTLEPLVQEPNGPNTVVKEIPSLESLVGFQTEFYLPRSKTPRPFGIFICRDNDGTNSCREKQVENISKLPEFYGKQGNPKFTKGMANKDKVYFFQLIRVGDTSLEVLTGDNEKEERMEKLAEHLRRSTQGENGESIATQVVNLNRAVDSIPITIKQNTIRINLPHYDKKKCR